MKRLLYLIFGILIFLFLGLEISKYWSQVSLADLNLNYYYLVILSILLLLYYLINSFIWVRILIGVGQSLNWQTGILIHTYSQAAKYLPGGMWNVLGRVFLCTKNGMNFARVSTSVFLEIVLNIIAGGILVVLTGYSTLELNINIVLVAGLLIVAWFYKPNLVIKPALLLYKKWRKQTIELNVSRKQLIIWTLFFTGAWLLYSLVFYFFIIGILHIPINYMFSVGVLILSWLVGFISPIPGGLGVREGSMTALLSIQLSYSDALSISLFTRLWLIILEVILYVFTFIYAKKSKIFN
ncbi:Lysylphosphatidylglycerol synthase TM region [Paenibacillus barengoltzii]|jgi:hypothetical protein|uniref:lysylphosphatidylglycerol synthase domain-containing protein n=1 Tax=Paenibacillus barengoltzii TaxID=343517 RepID=UPI000A08BA90|nr:lysylphosphatidylglycerol synthase domain-containing protein [Paenibacillus barengoltzii]SMF32053.1 Lysylphosphatidylglycerol synthase TM region [Paenibacillus barengoltzii]